MASHLNYNDGNMFILYAVFNPVLSDMSSSLNVQISALPLGTNGIDRREKLQITDSYRDIIQEGRIINPANQYHSLLI